MNDNARPLLQPEHLALSELRQGGLPRHSGMIVNSPRTHAEQILRQGLDHYHRGAHEQALAAFIEAIHADPSFAAAYNNLGMVLIDLERYEDALDSLYDSVRCDANYSEAYNNLGFALRRLGHNLEAASAYQQFLELEPGVEESALIAAWINSVLAVTGRRSAPRFALPEHQGNTLTFQPAELPEPVQEVAEPPKVRKMAFETVVADVATAELASEVADSGDIQDPGKQTGLAVSDATDTPASSHQAAAALGMDETVNDDSLHDTPGAADVATMRQWILQVKNNPKVVSPRVPNHNAFDFNQAAPMKPKNLAADVARADGERVPDVEVPDPIRMTFLLGHAKIRQGQFAAAAATFQQVLDLDPTHADALYGLGQCAEKAGDMPRAVTAFRTYIEKHPKGPYAEELRTRFSAQGAVEPKKAPSKQLKCERCLQSFDACELSTHESKTVCKACLELMNTTPIQDSKDLETVDSAEPARPSNLRGGSPWRRVAALGLVGLAACFGLGYFTPYLSPALAKTGINKRSQSEIVKPPKLEPMSPKTFNVALAVDVDHSNPVAASTPVMAGTSSTSGQVAAVSGTAVAVTPQLAPPTLPEPLNFPEFGETKGTIFNSPDLAKADVVDLTIPGTTDGASTGRNSEIEPRRTYGPSR